MVNMHNIAVRTVSIEPRFDSSYVDTLFLKNGALTSILRAHLSRLQYTPAFPTLLPPHPYHCTTSSLSSLVHGRSSHPRATRQTSSLLLHPSPSFRHFPHDFRPPHPTFRMNRLALWLLWSGRPWARRLPLSHFSVHPSVLASNSLVVLSEAINGRKIMHAMHFPKTQRFNSPIRYTCPSMVIGNRELGE
jgi:hypothetical protein